MCALIHSLALAKKSMEISVAASSQVQMFLLYELQDCVEGKSVTKLISELSNAVGGNETKLLVDKMNNTVRAVMLILIVLHC